MLYLLSFYLPRFLKLPWREKLATVIHELWHVNPQFNGDLPTTQAAVTLTRIRSGSTTPTSSNCWTVG